MADMKMHKVEKQVPPFLKEMTEKPKADFPRVYLTLDSLPPEAVDLPMNGKVRIVLEGEIVGRSQQEMRGGEEVIGSLDIEVHQAGCEALESDTKVSRKAERGGEAEGDY